MRDINPNSSKSAVEEKTWNTSSRDQRIGFINRDAETSETIANPDLLSPLGVVMAPELRIHEQVDSHKHMIWAPGSSTTDNARSGAGIAVIDFLPIFGTSSAYFAEGTRSIFVDKWSEFRQIYSGVEAFQPGDLHAVTAQTMNLKMHIMHLYRTLRLMNSKHPTAESMFSTRNIWAKASGWNISDATISTKYPEWHSMYNMIVGTFNKINWLKDFIPGADRWMAMCSEIYKDTSADTEYCQAYLFRPRAYYSLTTTKDAEKIVTWTLQPIANYYQQNTTDESVAVSMFEQYLNRVYNDVVDLYYDSSVQQIISTLGQVAKITKQDDLLEHFDMPYLTMDPEPYALVWDFATMLAVLNATIVDVDLDSSAAVVNGKVGIMEQTVHVNIGEQDYMGTTLPKLINLPCFVPTNADVANATQWTIVTDKLHGDTRTELNPSSYGTEILTRVSVMYRHYVSGQGDDSVVTRYHQYVALRDAGEAHGLGSAGMQEFAIQAGSNFAFMPMIYTCHWNSTDSIYEVENVIGQLEVCYALDFPTVRKIHDVWSNNFWGFPARPARVGTVTLETER